jgi:4-hydroxythreonine-4-phosphate dehydrogenase
VDNNIRLYPLAKGDISRIRLLARTDALAVINCPLRRPVKPGYPDPENARAVLETLDVALEGAREKYFDAMVTAPIQKSTINAAGIAFTGHTEYLAEKLQTEQVVMLLAGKTATVPDKPSPFLRIALATTHLPLKDIPVAITQASLAGTIRILHQELQGKFGIAHPRILVSGLNPHAGENGYLGTEEMHTIIPAIQSAQQEGILAEGPLPADTLFLPHYLDHADAFLVMYHDQGLPVLKYAAFGQGINITLGLPIIRTSTDHGTALDIARQGTGLANDGSMQQAIRLAGDMATLQKQLSATR